MVSLPKKPSAIPLEYRDDCCLRCIKSDVCKYKEQFKNARYIMKKALEGNDSFSQLLDIVDITCKIIKF